jgi:hypothetical protein
MQPGMKRYQDRPATVGALTGDPYRALIAGILERAIRDTTGRCAPVLSSSKDTIEREARTWLTEDAAALLEMAGYDPDPVLRRVWQILGPA